MNKANGFVTSSISNVRIDYSFVSMAPRIIAFTGTSGSGKTTLIVGLIPLLKANGRSLGVIKHTHHRIGEIARGDSESYLSAGATAVVLCDDSEALRLGRDSEGSTQLIERRSYAHPSDLPAMAATDLVLIEGFKQIRAWPRILVMGETERVEVLSIDSFAGVVSDRPFEHSIVRFGHTAFGELALFVDRIAIEIP